MAGHPVEPINVIASEAKQSSFAETSKMDCFVASAPRNDGSRVSIRVSNSRCTSAFSRRDAPEVCVSLSLKHEGAGNAGCALHPRSRVQKAEKKTHTSIQVQRRLSDIPCAMALRLTPRSPRRRIRLVTVVGELAASPRPVGPACLRQLDTSNGCQNHTASPYASASFVCAPFDRSRVWLNPKPALQFTCAPDAAASTASHPNVRDDGQRPFLGDRMAGVLKVICPTAKAKICPSGYFVAATILP